MDYERFMRTYRCLLRVRDIWDSLLFALKLEQMAQEPHIPYCLTPTGMAAIALRQEALHAQDPGR
jgi:hypothetical protein